MMFVPFGESVSPRFIDASASVVQHDSISGPNKRGPCYRASSKQTKLSPSEGNAGEVIRLFSDNVSLRQCAYVSNELGKLWNWVVTNNFS